MAGKLVLSRKVGESIAIAGGIEIFVEQIAGGKVRLGVCAPSTVLVLRRELPGADDLIAVFSPGPVTEPALQVA